MLRGEKDGLSLIESGKSWSYNKILEILKIVATYLTKKEQKEEVVKRLTKINEIKNKMFADIESKDSNGKLLSLSMWEH